MAFLSRARMMPVAAVVVAALAAGPVIAQDKGANSIGLPAPEAVQPLYFEAEDLLPALESFEAPGERAEGIAVARRLEADDVFSGNAGVELTNVDVGTRMTLRFEVPAGGAYNVAVRMGLGPAYGIVQVSLDGRPLGEPFNGYAATAGRSEELVLGRVELAEGSHTLTFTARGKAEAATAHGVSVDYLELEP